MLPTVAVEESITGATARPGAAPAQPAPATTPCQTCRAFFADDLDAQFRAAALCEACPLVEACLAEALRVDAAYAHGRDRYGISGVCGGVVFDPGHLPHRPGQDSLSRAGTSAAA